MLECYYYIGSTIVELLELTGKEKSQNELLKSLSIKLTSEFEQGFDRSNLVRMKQYYEIYKTSATSYKWYYKCTQLSARKFPQF